MKTGRIGSGSKTKKDEGKSCSLKAKERTADLFG